VLASKLGADSNLVLSPEKTKLGCCKLVLLVAEALTPWLEERRSIQGTATCLPPAAGLVEELIPVLVDELELALPVLEPGLVSDRTANSTRPDRGLMMVSLMVPT
jgi:hypothetical protein